MNTFEINPNKYILIAIEQKIILIPFNKYNLSFAKPITIFECADVINQIKLMSIPDSKDEIIIALDNSGIVTTALISKKNSISNIKKFKATIDSNDNSVWSIDCQYPYIVIGGNHKCVMLFNYETSEEMNSKSIIYIGNEHNVPCVSISKCGLFVGNNSIDQVAKIFDIQTGKLIAKIDNPKSEWGWGVSFIPKNLFREQDSSFKDNVKKKKSSNYYKEYLRNSLIDKYYILTSFQNSATLNELSFADEENDNDITIKNNRISQMNLLENFIKLKYFNMTQYNYLMIQTFLSTSRYEYIFYTEKTHLIFLGNKNGDLHVYEMSLFSNTLDEEEKTIIDFGERLAGIRIKEESENIVDIYALTLRGTLYNYRMKYE